MLSQGQGHKLETAVNRNGGNTTDIEWLCTGGNFGLAVRLIRNQATLEIRKQSSEGLKESLIIKVDGGNHLKDYLAPSCYSGTRLIVDYDQPFSLLMHKAACETTSMDNPQIDHTTFPERLSGSRPAWFEVVQFTEWGRAKPQLIKKEFADAGCRGASLVELLSFASEVGAFCQGYNGLVGLGSAVKKTAKQKRFLFWQRKISDAVLIYPHVDRNLLRPQSGDGGWKPEMLFLAVRA